MHLKRNIRTMKTNYRVRDLLLDGYVYDMSGRNDHLIIFKACIRKLLKNNGSSVPPVMSDVRVSDWSLTYHHADFTHVYRIMFTTILVKVNGINVNYWYLYYTKQMQ
jgi:hypothetical protein